MNRGYPIPATPAFAAARPAAESRPALIACFLHLYERETAAGRTVLCSQRDYVNDWMRESGQPRLSDAEAARFRVSSTEPGAREDRELGMALGDAGRAALIAKARAAYAVEAARCRSMLTSELAWVNLALRDANAPKLTAPEIASQRIEGDGFASVCAGTGSEVDALLQTLGLSPGATPWDAALAVTDANVAAVAELLGLPAGSSLDEVRLALAQRMVSLAQPGATQPQSGAPAGAGGGAGGGGGGGRIPAGGGAVPAGQTVARCDLIRAAINSFTAERTVGKTALCSPREWVNAGLREAGLPVLSGEEALTLHLSAY